MKKVLLILAKSFKNGGFCIAGCEIMRNADGRHFLSSTWIRPVVSADGVACGALPAAWCRDISVLDIVEINFSGHTPVGGQPENWMMEAGHIRKLGEFSNMNLLSTLSSSCVPVWSDASTFRADQVCENIAQHGTASLTLAAPRNLTFTLALENCWDGKVKRRIYASFNANGQNYMRISVTDPVISRIFKHQFPTTPGTQVELKLNHGDNYFLTMSLSPKFKDGLHYVLVAGVLDQTGYLNKAYR